MTEKLELCKFIYKNSNIPMRTLAKKSIPYLRALKTVVIQHQDQEKKNNVHRNMQRSN